MNNIAKVVLAVVLLALVLGVVYQQIEIQDLKSEQGASVTNTPIPSSTTQPFSPTATPPSTVTPTVTTTGGVTLNITAIQAMTYQILQR